jgi:hypothetical protein
MRAAAITAVPGFEEGAYSPAARVYDRGFGLFLLTLPAR